MLISIGLYMFNVVCAARFCNMQNCPRQLAMQSCALCLYVRCGSSNQIKRKEEKKKKKSQNSYFCVYILVSIWKITCGKTSRLTA